MAKKKKVRRDRKPPQTAEEIESLGNRLIEAGNEILEVAQQMRRSEIDTIEPQGLGGVEDGISFAKKFFTYCEGELRQARLERRQ